MGSVVASIFINMFSFLPTSLQFLDDLCSVFFSFPQLIDIQIFYLQL